MEDKRWSIVSSEYKIRNKWLTVRKDHIRQPSGVEIEDYWVLEYPEWINVIAITEDGKFVIERQYRHAIGLTDYEIPAGCCEQGEEPLTAAKRELHEETGYAGGTWTEFMTISPNGTSMTNMTHCYIATGVLKDGDAHQEETEDIDVSLMTKEEVRTLLEGGHFWQATMAAPLWKFFCKN